MLREDSLFIVNLLEQQEHRGNDEGNAVVLLRKKEVWGSSDSPMEMRQNSFNRNNEDSKVAGVQTASAGRLQVVSGNDEKG